MAPLDFYPELLLELQLWLGSGSREGRSGYQFLLLKLLRKFCCDAVAAQVRFHWMLFNIFWMQEVTYSALQLS